MRAAISIAFKANTPSGPITGITRGQKARTLLALHQAGSRGITALECGAWAFRLAAYCFFLKEDFGLVIRCDKEDHPGGWHGRHVLENDVQIISVEGIDRGEVAA
jgi:hypothetical protein